MCSVNHIFIYMLGTWSSKDVKSGFSLKVSLKKTVWIDAFEGEYSMIFFMVYIYNARVVFL